MATERREMITDNEVLTVNPIRIPVAVVRTAKFSPWRVPRDKARSWILDRIIDGLNPESSLRLAEYEKQEDPCEVS